jgi:hypothetical protein
MSAPVLKVTAQRLVGAWRLQRWEAVNADGTRTAPFGPDATGLLLYTRDGWMSASIMAAGRVPLSRSNPRDAPESERAGAFNSYFSYCGRWRTTDGAVHHDVTIALNPAMVGTLQVRKARLTSSTLTLSAEEVLPGGVRLHRLVWRRPARNPGSTRTQRPERNER